MAAGARNQLQIQGTCDCIACTSCNATAEEVCFVDKCTPFDLFRFYGKGQVVDHFPEQVFNFFWLACCQTLLRELYFVQGSVKLPLTRLFFQYSLMPVGTRIPDDVPVYASGPIVCEFELNTSEIVIGEVILLLLASKGHGVDVTPNAVSLGAPFRRAFWEKVPRDRELWRACCKRTRVQLFCCRACISRLPIFSVVRRLLISAFPNGSVVFRDDIFFTFALSDVKQVIPLTL